MTAGKDGILPEIGSITTLVDPIPYMQSVTNVDHPAGGTDAESDEDLRDRIYLAPSSYSVAGPEDAYAYWTQKYSSSISDVMVFSPVAGDVHVLIITEDGELPTQAQIDGLQAYLEDDEIRPLTDHVTVAAPELTSYSVGLTYYIGRSGAAKVTAIQDAVAQAVADYVLWQQSKIGRDINPDQLINMVIAAGAKRVILASPAFIMVPKDHVARISGEPVITYGGLEDD
jgi:phage-related baseplate assembly protein